ncbi:MAG: DUF5996 family protein [Chloroflexi bacterium]|nr:DUF5996 family protein [Chloroflexota bacterium]
MTHKFPFPKLVNWRETRETLHAYSKVLGAVRAAFAPEQPRGQHVSLRLYTAGLTTTPVPHPDHPQVTFSISLDLLNHYVLLSSSDGSVQQFRMSEGWSASQLGEELLGKLAKLGVHGKVEKGKYESDEPRRYALDAAERYFTALSHMGRLLEQFRGGLPGEKDPVQFWPHGFDLAFVLLGSKQVKTMEGESPSQITFGFSPDDPGQPTPYIYATPFPFEEDVTHKKLPDGAVWHTAIWQGALLPYPEVAEKEDGEKRVLDFLQAAYQLEKSLI